MLSKLKKLEDGNQSSSSAEKLRRTDFRFREKLGRGTFGSVYRAVPKQPSRLPGAPREVAIKVIKEPMLTFPQTNFYEEYETQRLVSEHSNITSMYGMFRVLNRTYLVMELIGDGNRRSDLKTFMREHKRNEKDGKSGGLPEQTALHIALQITSALRYMHEKGIVHRDIAMDNIGVCLSSDSDDGVVAKLIDFGMANEFDPAKPQSAIAPAGEWCGSGRSMPPQMHEGMSFDMLKSDIYSFGTVLHELLCGEAAFKYDGIKWEVRHVTFLKQKSAPLRLDGKKWAHVQGCTKELVARMLSPDEKVRPCAVELEQYLRSALTKLHVEQGHRS